MIIYFIRFFGYQKQIIRNKISQYFLKNRLRFSIRIDKCCVISPDFKYGKNVKLKSYVSIGSNVELGDDVIVGSNSCLSNIKIGKDSQIEGGVIITGNGNGKIIIGKDSYVGINNVLDWSDNITIGDFVHIAGPSTGLWTHSSAKMCMNSIPLINKSEEFRPTAPIVIESNVYIGGNCTIYPGVTIGHHSIVAPNSAVTKSVEPFTMVGGVPAKKLKDLSDLKKLNETANS